jgi:hypothetical protein
MGGAGQEATGKDGHFLMTVIKLSILDRLR